jgi:hypothetical protein
MWLNRTTSKDGYARIALCHQAVNRDAWAGFQPGAVRCERVILSHDPEGWRDDRCDVWAEFSIDVGVTEHHCAPLEDELRHSVPFGDVFGTNTEFLPAPSAVLTPP